MLVFPNCKINIGLNITGRRSDGYHDLETVFYPVYKLYDAIEVLPQVADNHEKIIDFPGWDNSLYASMETSFTTDDSGFIQYQLSGLPVSGDAQNNLCLKAYHLLKKDFPELPPVRLCLHKAIPMGAGLGGGSADGAFMLQLLNQKFGLQLLTSQLLDYALQLGSDCPFFIINKPAFAWGRGEMLETISLNLAGYAVVLIHPGIHVSTKDAFVGIIPKPPVKELQEVVMQPVETWKHNVVNDFEEIVFSKHPLLSQIKNRLYESGAVYAAMSGSGSTVYGIYKKPELPKEKMYPEFFEMQAVL